MYSKDYQVSIRVIVLFKVYFTKKFLVFLVLLKITFIVCISDMAMIGVCQVTDLFVSVTATKYACMHIFCKIHGDVALGFLCWCSICQP